MDATLNPPAHIRQTYGRQLYKHGWLSLAHRGFLPFRMVFKKNSKDNNDNNDNDDNYNFVIILEGLCTRYCDQCFIHVMRFSLHNNCELGITTCILEIGKLRFRED